MSGHSKWENIKRRKGAQDQKRGKIFSKLAHLITIAAKEGGSPDPEVNSKLRLAIDRAKSENMPRENIERAIKSATEKRDNLQQFILEGYGPGGVAILINVLTDNRQRTIQEVKNLFQRADCCLSGPGAASFQFNEKMEPKTLIPVNDPQTKGKLQTLLRALEEHEDIERVASNAE